jgi:CRP/FNR family transcriptional regulator, cyclic AMP receptor protein
MSRGDLSGAIVEAKTRLQKQVCELGLAPEVAEEVFGHHVLMNYNKGATVASCGSPAQGLFYVITGMLKVYCPRPNGTRTLVKLVGPGDVVGYADYVDAKGHRAQVFGIDALTKSSVALFTREHILKILSTLEQSVLLRAIERLNTAWSAMAQWFGTFLGMSFQERLELVLSELATKFGVRDSRGILLTPELVHADFADMIGSSRPMVTRLMAEMIKQGLLLREGKRLILPKPPVDQLSSIEEKKKLVVPSRHVGSLGSLSRDDASGAKTRESASARLTQGTALRLAEPPTSDASFTDS